MASNIRVRCVLTSAASPDAHTVFEVLPHVLRQHRLHTPLADEVSPRCAPFGDGDLILSTASTGIQIAGSSAPAQWHGAAREYGLYSSKLRSAA